MLQYFKPLRRKIGMVTQVMACLFAVGWVRSLIVADEVDWGRGNLDHQLISHAGSIRWQYKRWQMSGSPPDDPVPIVQRIRFVRPDKRELALDPMKMFSENRRDYAGISFGTFTSDESKSTSTQPRMPRPYVVWHKSCVIQYWLPTIPLTLLSAWLLLSRLGPLKNRSVISAQ